MPLNVRAFRARRRVLIKVSCLIFLVVAANIAAEWLVDALKLDIRPSTEDVVHRMIMISAIAYALLIAIPFVPGIEIGLTLLGMFGPAVVFLVYVCTLAGLSISYVIGRLVSTRWMIKLLDDLHLERTSELLKTVEPLSMKDRLTVLASKAPNRYVPFLLRHRYLALAVLVNLPGNIVIGGGGGIALVAGASGLYSLPRFVATIAVAVSPVPLAVLVFGKQILSG